MWNRVFQKSIILEATTQFEYHSQKCEARKLLGVFGQARERLQKLKHCDGFKLIFLVINLKTSTLTYTATCCGPYRQIILVNNSPRGGSYTPWVRSSWGTGGRRLSVPPELPPSCADQAPSPTIWHSHIVKLAPPFLGVCFFVFFFNFSPPPRGGGILPNGSPFGNFVEFWIDFSRGGAMICLCKSVCLCVQACVWPSSKCLCVSE